MDLRMVNAGIGVEFRYKLPSIFSLRLNLASIQSITYSVMAVSTGYCYGLFRQAITVPDVKSWLMAETRKIYTASARSQKLKWNVAAVSHRSE
jgi:hypothetical protein